MLAVRNLRKFYGDFLALQDVSFEVERGEVVGFLGPNGAGKSTTMKAIVGFVPASRGSIHVDGLDVTRFPIDTRRRIGYLPEHTPLYGDMRVREFLNYRARIKGIPRRQVAARVDYVLDRTWLQDRVRQPIETLSKGYRQRVGLADALVGDPKLLILDEPTIGLDPNQVRDVRKLIKELGESHTIVLSTHILGEVEMVCSRVVIIAKGATVEDDTVAGLLDKYRENTISLTIRADETTDKLKTTLAAVEGVAAVEPRWEESQDTLQRFLVRFHDDSDETAVAEALAGRVAAEGWALSELKSRRPTLEQIFVRLTMTAEKEEAEAEAEAEQEAAA